MIAPIPPQVRLPLPIAPRGGAIGTVVSLSATGLPPNASLLIAFANLQSYQLLQRVLTDADGSFATTQEVPSWAQLDGAHYFFASFDDEKPLAFSHVFHVTRRDGVARISGTIEGQSGGCVDLRKAVDVVYHLVGDIGEFKAGDRVSVTGTFADPAACGGTGVAIAVTAITAR